MEIVCLETKTREEALAGWRHGQAAGPGRTFWDRLVLVDRAEGSQYDSLRRRPLDEAPGEAEAWVALTGKGFHGQRRRRWRAHRGNLHLSVSVPLDRDPGSHPLTWTMLPAVAALKAVRALAPGAGPAAGIKWVNDILWEGRKLGGVLSSVAQVDGRLRRGHLGIGLNVAVAPDLEAGDATGGTACLADLGCGNPPPLGRVLQEMLAALAGTITLFQAGRDEEIIRAYGEGSLVVGRDVRIMSDPFEGPEVELCRGRVTKLAPDLSLVLEGVPEPVTDGRLFFLGDGES